MNDEQFMRMAIKEALKSTEPLKCGVVIAKDGQVVAKSYNSQRSDCNACHHAEIKTIGKAGKKLSNKNLTGCIAYCTCEPCIMCLSAMTFAKIDTLFYGISLSDVPPLSIDIATDIVVNKSIHKVKIIPNFLRADCLQTIK